MNKKSLAKIISFVLGPQVWFPILIFLLIFKTGLNTQQILILLPLVFIFQLFIPLAALYLLIKTKQISDWDIRVRKERYKILPVFLISTLIAMALIFLFGNKLFFQLYLTLWITALVGVAITYFWKISLHLMLNVTAILMVNFLFSWHLSILYILIPIVGWARYYNKHHTPPQIVAGSVVSGLIVIGMLRYFNYL